MCRKLFILTSVVLVISLALTNVANAKVRLIGWWPFDGDTQDYSGLNNHGAAYGDPTFVSGKVGSNAIYLDGDDYVTMDNLANDITDNDCTFSGWVKTTVTSDTYWFSCNTSARGNVALWGIDSTGVAMIVDGPSPAYKFCHSTTIVNDDEWHLLTFTRKGLLGTTYVDGIAENTYTATPAFDFGPDDLWSIGQEWDGGGPSNFLTGSVDDVRFYDVALSAAQVLDLFNGIVPTFPFASAVDPGDGASVSALGLVLRWDAGETAAWHDVYFGSDHSAVTKATSSDPMGPDEVYKARQPDLPSNAYLQSGLVRGRTYYWRIDEVEADGTTIHKGEVWSFWVMTYEAHNPSPEDAAKSVSLNTDLSWGAGSGALYHTIYFGTDPCSLTPIYELYEDTICQIPGTVTIDYDTTYYWRVTELRFEPGIGPVYTPGPIWSFTTRAIAGDPDLLWLEFDRNLLDSSGLNNHGTAYGGLTFAPGKLNWALYLGGDDYVTMDGVADDITNNDITLSAWVNTTDAQSYWLSCNGGVTRGNANTILFAVDNGPAAMYEDDGGIKARSTTIVNDGEWHLLTFTRAGSLGTTYVDAVAEGTATFTYTFRSDDRWSIGQEWDTATASNFLIGTVDDVRIYSFGLSAEEVEIIMRGEPELAANPNPPNYSTPDIEHATPLGWSPGEKAAKHHVYFGTDKDTVKDADTATTNIYRGRQDPNTYTPPEGVEFGQTYHWRIDEYNTDATISKGRVWRFTVSDYLTVDDFEDYNDYCSRIFYTWTDGWGHSGDATCGVAAYGGNGTGSTVGYLQEPYAEQTIVHQGRQSMPFEYLNDGSTGKALYSETQRTFEPSQDWTRHGVKALTLWFRGYPDTLSSFAGPDPYTMTAGGGDIWGTADRFHFVWKNLSGQGSIVTRLDSLEGENPHVWAKAGVMIRETLDANAVHAMVIVTPINRLQFAWRNAIGGTSDSTYTDPNAIALPHWVRLTRQGNTFTAHHSTDGLNWQAVGDPTSANVVMGSNVFIGLALTSQRDAARIPITAVFSNVSISGSVSGQWTSEDIGLNYNSAEQLYVAVEDSAGKREVANHLDPNAVLSDTWQEWNIALTAFSSDAGVNLRSVKKMYIGLGDGTAPKLGGAGMLYIDDIRLYRSRCVPSLWRPDADFNGNCVVDYPDLEIMANEWLSDANDLQADLDLDNEVNFKDYARLADTWLEVLLWP
jgi:hypothetical protein